MISTKTVTIKITPRSAHALAGRGILQSDFSFTLHHSSYDSPKANERLFYISDVPETIEDCEIYHLFMERLEQRKLAWRMTWGIDYQFLLNNGTNNSNYKNKIN